MLYELAHTIQTKAPWIWDGVEMVNAALCGLKVGDRMKLKECLPANVRMADVNDAGRLADFFARQPEGSFKWFRPHAFDEATMRKLLGRKSYIIYVQEEDGEIVGYAFLRCFMNGKSFLGKMVDVIRERECVPHFVEWEWIWHQRRASVCLRVSIRRTLVR